MVWSSACSLQFSKFVFRSRNSRAEAHSDQDVCEHTLTLSTGVSRQNPRLESPTYNVNFACFIPAHVQLGHTSECDSSVHGYCTNESVPVPLAEASLGVLKKVFQNVDVVNTVIFQAS